MDAEPERIARLHHVAAALADAAGVTRVAGAVLSVEMPGPIEALTAQADCARDGVRVGCFRPPSTPDDISRLRLTASAGIDDDELALSCKLVGTVVP
jgi:8-amino-7-oxononanoate synthase